MSLSLTIACRAYDRVIPLMDGRVRVEGCNTTVVPLKMEEILSRAYGRAEFDVAELSMSSHIITTELGISPYVAIPVFISRMFRHSAIYIRTDRGISRPEDLLGKLVGVPEYQMTAALWVRGMLSDVYGVASDKISWRTGGLSQPGRQEKFGLTFGAPFDVKPIPADQTLDAMFARGDLDAIVSARAPSCYLNRSAPVDRLFRDFVSEEKSYFRKTGLFPIMHVIGVRRDLVERNPWLPTSVFKAFAASKTACMAAIEDDNALQVTMPWALQNYAEAKDVMGREFWPYGVGQNQNALSAMIRYSREQGLTHKIDDIADLFTPCEEEIAGA
ncbi:4,5-dihydroxyphthalate decarboxylase [Metarhizobium album]|uniref:4,5-dihydroxyphthalate decarboxylase n=1 Tax=Metarhizobium album TaxID=2182425 RepID=A0A2U2DJE8_9HYPH|nr:4,5-dihydroxyphthalate decarboxylase [Rhizobium album]PWE53435.1 4,5-dihydroxyphthalate decarboxylase [Rhizobium album]